MAKQRMASIAVRFYVCFVMAVLVAPRPSLASPPPSGALTPDAALTDFQDLVVVLGGQGAIQSSLVDKLLAESQIVRNELNEPDLNEARDKAVTLVVDQIDVGLKDGLLTLDAADLLYYRGESIFAALGIPPLNSYLSARTHINHLERQGEIAPSLAWELRYQLGIARTSHAKAQIDVVIAALGTLMEKARLGVSSGQMSSSAMDSLGDAVQNITDELSNQSSTGVETKWTFKILTASSHAESPNVAWRSFHHAMPVPSPASAFVFLSSFPLELASGVHLGRIELDEFFAPAPISQGISSLPSVARDFSCSIALRHSLKVKRDSDCGGQQVKITLPSVDFAGQVHARGYFTGTGYENGGAASTIGWWAKLEKDGADRYFASVPDSISVQAGFSDSDGLALKIDAFGTLLAVIDTIAGELLGGPLGKALKVAFEIASFTVNATSANTPMETSGSLTGKSGTTSLDVDRVTLDWYGSSFLTCTAKTSQAITSNFEGVISSSGSGKSDASGEVILKHLSNKLIASATHEVTDRRCNLTVTAEVLSGYTVGGAILPAEQGAVAARGGVLGITVWQFTSEYGVVKKVAILSPFDNVDVVPYETVQGKVQPFPQGEGLIRATVVFEAPQTISGPGTARVTSSSGTGAFEIP